MTFFLDGLVDHLRDEHAYGRLCHITIKVIIGVNTFYFLDPVQVCVLTIIYHQLKKRQRLVQCDPAPRRPAPYPIHNITLQSELIGEYRYDDGSLTVLCKSENDSSYFMKHGGCV